MHFVMQSILKGLFDSRREVIHLRRRGLLTPLPQCVHVAQWVRMAFECNRYSRHYCQHQSFIEHCDVTTVELTV